MPSAVRNDQIDGVRLRGRTGLLAYASVDPLAQQVGVTEVAGVLVDRSDQHRAQRVMHRWDQRQCAGVLRMPDSD